MWNPSGGILGTLAFVLLPAGIGLVLVAFSIIIIIINCHQLGTKRTERQRRVSHVNEIEKSTPPMDEERW